MSTTKPTIRIRLDPLMHEWRKGPGYSGPAYTVRYRNQGRPEYAPLRATVTEALEDARMLAFQKATQITIEER